MEANVPPELERPHRVGADKPGYGWFSFATDIHSVSDAPDRRGATWEGWVHEPNCDGYRTQFVLQNGQARALTRRGNDWSDRFAVLVEAVKTLHLRAAIFEGETVVLAQRGVPDFHALKLELARGTDSRIVCMAFDVLDPAATIDGRWAPVGEAVRGSSRSLHEGVSEL